MNSIKRALQRSVKDKMEKQIENYKEFEIEMDEKSFQLEKKKISEYLNDYFKLILEGNSLKDSFAIFFYMLGTPIRFLKRTFHIYSEPKLIYGVTIKNKDAILFCGNSWLKTQGAISDYEIALRKYFNLNNGTFIDVGANIGKYSIMVGRKSDSIKVISIEASKENFEVLKKNIELNNLHNIIPLNIAASDRKGMSDFYLACKGLGTASSLFEIKKQSKKIRVKTDTLDNVVKNFNIKKVSLIKIDVEGAEPKVLKGAIKMIKRDKPRIIFEALNKKSFEECSKIIKKLNYKIKRISQINFVATHHNIKCQ